MSDSEPDPDVILDDSLYDPEAILADPNSHPIHRMYAQINIDVRDNGTPWSKCANCGQPYVITEMTGSTICSDKCEREYTAYLKGDLR